MRLTQRYSSPNSIGIPAQAPTLFPNSNKVISVSPGMQSLNQEPSSQKIPDPTRVTQIIGKNSPAAAGGTLTHFMKQFTAEDI